MRLRVQRHNSVRIKRIDVSASALVAAPWAGGPARANAGPALFATTALSTGALCGLALAASLALAPTPAAAQCVSGATGNIADPACNTAAATGADSTAVGFNANATGLNATAYGNGAVANGTNATATGQNANANGAFATATGQFSFANGTNATATGEGSFANGTFATATGVDSNAPERPRPRRAQTA